MPASFSASIIGNTTVVDGGVGGGFNTNTIMNQLQDAVEVEIADVYNQGRKEYLD